MYHKRMDEEKIYQEFEQELVAFANKYSIDRLKLSTVNFDREFKRGQDGSFLLVSTKAVIRTLGKVTKVPVGEGCEFSTFEEAEAATKKYWSEYYKNIRAKRTDAEKRAEAQRQKRYREQRKAKNTEKERQQ